jgi:hypothetical protein
MSGFFSTLVKHFLGLLGNGLTFRGSVLASWRQTVELLPAAVGSVSGCPGTMFCPVRHLKGEVP